jgi:hypothetical protein
LLEKASKFSVDQISESLLILCSKQEVHELKNLMSARAAENKTNIKLVKDL